MSDEARAPQQRAVNVNTATVEQLYREVSGIGPVLAERIVAWREAHGPFARRDDLIQVPGIGPTLLARLGEQLVIEDQPEGAPWAGDDVDISVSDELSAEPVAQESSVSEARPDLSEEEAPCAAPPSETEAPLLTAPDLEPSEEVTSQAPLSAEWEAELAAAPEIAEVEAVGEDQGVKGSQAAAPEAPIEPTVTESHSPAPTPAPPAQRSFWGGLGLVLLGGLAGVALTLLAAVIWSGTVDFAPRRQFEALSRNVNTMYANQELAWHRLDELALRTDELERKVKRLEALEERLGTVESDLRTAETRLASMHDAMTSLSAQVAAMQEEMKAQWGQLDGRLAGVEGEVEAMAATISQLQEELGAAQARIKVYDGFLQGLRSLLEDLEPTPAASKTP